LSHTGSSPFPVLPFPLRFNQLMGVRCRGRLLGAAGPSQAPARHHLLVYKRFLVAVLRILGVRSSLSSPSFVGACGAGISLRRSFVAYFLREFPALAQG
jgi:hypothetical protein